jgi:hypothetical protein
LKAVGMVLSDRVRFPVPLFDDKTLWNIYIKQKTRNLTRIPIFAMIGGVRMCDFCRNKKKIIDCKGNLVIFGAENNMIFDNSDGKEVAGAVKINFCPICGRKLV